MSLRSSFPKALLWCGLLLQTGLSATIVATAAMTEIACPNTAPCTVQCNTATEYPYDGLCSQKTIRCPSDHDCIVECRAEDSCELTTIECPTNGNCDIRSSTIRSSGISGYLTVFCPQTGDCNLACTAVSSCYKARVTCPTNGDCRFQCTASSACWYVDDYITWSPEPYLNQVTCSHYNACFSGFTAPPTRQPTSMTTAPTMTTFGPTNAPTFSPSVAPTDSPSDAPSQHPSFSPTAHPTMDPTADPTMSPTLEPTVDPTLMPSVDPTSSPTDITAAPSVDPTQDPTTRLPTLGAFQAWTPSPTVENEKQVEEQETDAPTIVPTRAPIIDGQNSHQDQPQVEVQNENVQLRMIVSVLGGAFGVILLLALAVAVYFCCVKNKKKKAQDSQQPIVHVELSTIQVQPPTTQVHAAGAALSLQPGASSVAAQSSIAAQPNSNAYVEGIAAGNVTNGGVALAMAQNVMLDFEDSDESDGVLFLPGPKTEDKNRKQEAHEEEVSDDSSSDARDLYAHAAGDMKSTVKDEEKDNENDDDVDDDENDDLYAAGPGKVTK